MFVSLRAVKSFYIILEEIMLLMDRLNI